MHAFDGNIGVLGVGSLFTNDHYSITTYDLNELGDANFAGNVGLNEDLYVDDTINTNYLCSKFGYGCFDFSGTPVAFTNDFEVLGNFNVSGDSNFTNIGTTGGLYVDGNSVLGHQLMNTDANSAVGTNAVAFGSGTTAFGNYSTALGSETVASGIGSMASGYINEQGVGSVGEIRANGIGAFAGGYALTGVDISQEAHIVASGEGSTAIGKAYGGSFDSAIAKITSSGTGSLAGGYSYQQGEDTTAEIKATSSGSIAYGYLTDNAYGSVIESSGIGSVALGYGSGSGAEGSIKATNNAAFAMGLAGNNNIVASGIASTAIGGANTRTHTATGTASGVLGIDNQATANYAWVIGRNSTAEAQTAIALGENIINSNPNSVAVYDLNVGNDANIYGDLNVWGTIYGDGSNLTGINSDVNGADIRPQNVSIDNNLMVRGDTNFHGDVAIGGALYGASPIDIRGGVEFTGGGIKFMDSGGPGLTITDDTQGGMIFTAGYLTDSTGYPWYVDGAQFYGATYYDVGTASYGINLSGEAGIVGITGSYLDLAEASIIDATGGWVDIVGQENGGTTGFRVYDSESQIQFQVNTAGDVNIANDLNIGGDLIVSGTVTGISADVNGTDIKPQNVSIDNNLMVRGDSNFTNIGVSEGSYLNNIIATGDANLQNTQVQGDLNVNSNINAFDGNANTNFVLGASWNDIPDGMTLNFATQNAWYRLDLSQNTRLNGFAVSDYNLVTELDGLYEVTYTAEGSGQNNHTYMTSVLVNDLNQDNCNSRQKLAAGGDITPMDSFCLIDLRKGDYISLAASDLFNTGNGTVYNYDLKIVRIGRYGLGN